MAAFHPPEAIPADAFSIRNPPSVNLWIGNLSPDVSEAELKALLEKYGEVNSITSYASRNYAFVYFNNIEDAKSAKMGLQGFLLRGLPLKIEFAKPPKACKSLWVAGISPSLRRDELEKSFLKFGKIQEFRFLKDPSTAFVDYVRLEDAVEALKNMNGKVLFGSQIRVDYLRPLSSRKQPFLSIGSPLVDSFVSNMLLIRHPPSVVIDEDMLHNTVILFGEIEKIRTMNDSCILVEFRSAEEAKRAKEALQGRLFNDPRISIEFCLSEFLGGRGLVGEYPIQSAQMDMIGLNRAVPQSINPSLLPLGIIEPDIYAQPNLIPYGTFNPPLHGQEFIDLAAAHKLQTSGSQMLIGEPNWRLSPSHGIATSTKPILSLPNQSTSGAWDAPDASLPSRESKRARIEAPAMPSGIVENHVGLDEQYGQHSLVHSEAISPLTRGGVGLRKRHAGGDCIWRGLIAKGGTPVCHARCVAIGDGLDADIPKVVNCSARTGLDLLTKHYEDAVGFDVVFFLPDSEDDFGSYTEFLRYLGSKDRAGVAKLDDGTTMFLVPPSSFLFKVLKVSGPERLYGVVLKFPPVAVLPPPHPSQLDQQTRYGIVPVPAVEQRSKPTTTPPVPLSQPMVPTSGPAVAASQVGLGLTPELIATLTSLLPQPVQNASSSRTNPVMPPIATPNGTELPNPPAGQWQQHEQNVAGTIEAPPPPPPVSVVGHVNIANAPPYNRMDVQSSSSMNLPQSQVQRLYLQQAENGEAEADKNERYKTTLAFAANLLSQIQQQQQPSMGGGS